MMTLGALSYTLKRQVWQVFIANFSPTQILFSHPESRYWNSKCICAHLCPHGRKRWVWEWGVFRCIVIL